jgi:hypothetical protein
MLSAGWTVASVSFQVHAVPFQMNSALVVANKADTKVRIMIQNLILRVGFLIKYSTVCFRDLAQLNLLKVVRF